MTVDQDGSDEGAGRLHQEDGDAQQEASEEAPESELRRAIHLTHVLFGATSLLLLLTTPSDAQAWELLIPKQSEWSYLDDGSDPGTAWREPEFGGNWAAGRAELGFGDGAEGAEGTVVRDLGMTVYFRRRFELSAEQLSRIKGLRIRVRLDDGVLVWLNGREIFRLGLRPGPVASTDDGRRSYNDTHFFRWFTGPEHLREGTNVVAVEVHKANERDSTLSFDLELTGSTGEVEIWRGSYLQRGSPHGATIRFQTSIAVVPTLRFGTDALTESRLGEAGTDHAFVLEGLEPDTRYFYEVEAEGQVLTIPPDGHWFRTHPRRGADRPTRIWVIGDAGDGLFSGVHRVIRAYHFFEGQTPMDVWLMLGDNAYRSGTLEEHHNAVFVPFAPMLRNTFSWPVIGNHDERSFVDGGGPYFDVFTLPTHGESGGVPSGSEHYYAFDYGNIHFVALHATRDALAAGQPQLEWLERDLAANDSEWTIAFLHNAPYNTGEYHSDLALPSINVRQNALPILERHGVDLVLAGHSHYYQRSFQIRGLYGPSSSWDPAIHLVDGGDGCPNDDRVFECSGEADGAYGADGTVYVILGNSALVERGVELTHPTVSYGDVRGIGSLVIDVAGQRLEARYLQVDGTVADRFVILHTTTGHARTILLLLLVATIAGGFFLRTVRNRRSS